MIQERMYERAVYANHCRRSFEEYDYLIGRGWPRELARGVLPVSTYSRMFATVDLHNLVHFLRLRLHKHAQWEIQEYARALVTLVEPTCPTVIKMLKEEMQDGKVG
jgi:thymidylate synthase (FAD)